LLTCSIKRIDDAARSLMNSGEPRFHPVCVA
jgi:hypothetical protein